MAMTLTATAGASKKDIGALMRAQSGDEDAIPEVRQIMERLPELAAEIAEMGRVAELKLVEATAGENYLFAEAMQARAAQLRESIAGPDATPLEALLVARVVLSWMDACCVDVRYAQVVKDGFAWEQLREYSRWQDRAHRRFLTACKALAQVRRLLKPILAQVNIAAGPQMNVAELGNTLAEME